MTKRIFYRNGEPYRLIGLTLGKMTMVDADRYKEFSRFDWFTVHSKPSKTFYAARWIKCGNTRRLIHLHRHIMGTQRRKLIDHIDHDGLNNMRSNLRFASPSQSVWNTRLSKINTSGYKGVHWAKKSGKWYASIGYRNTRIFLGEFRDIIEAVKAYDRAAIKLFGEFSHTNFPR